MPPASDRVKVFVSYSHDSDEHALRVRRLSDRRRTEGIECRIDQYETAPAEGWRRWMEKLVDWADFVLVVCTETYARRARGEEASCRGPGIRRRAGSARESSVLASGLHHVAPTSPPAAECADPYRAARARSNSS